MQHEIYQNSKLNKKLAIEPTGHAHEFSILSLRRSVLYCNY